MVYYEQYLTPVKNGLGINSSYHDEVLLIYIREVVNFLLSAGVSETIISNKFNYGIVCRGVADLWNYGAGGTSLSEYFKQRASQLVLSGVDVDE